MLAAMGGKAHSMINDVFKRALGLQRRAEHVSFRRRRNLGVEDAEPRDSSCLGMTRFLHAAVRLGREVCPFYAGPAIGQRAPLVSIQRPC